MRPLSRLFKSVGLATAAVCLAVGVSTPSASGAAAPEASTLTVFSHTQVYKADQYFIPPFAPVVNWVSPVNWSAGRARLQLDVLSKPSSKLVLAQVCFWQHVGAVKFKYETCAKPVRVTDEGSWSVDLGIPNTWWQKNGFYPWTQPPSVVRILLKNPTDNTMMNNKRCKPVCYRGADLASHVPITMRATLTFTR